MYSLLSSSVLFILYPASLVLIHLLSRIYFYRLHDGRSFDRQTPSSYKAIWYLLICFCLVLFISIATFLYENPHDFAGKGRQISMPYLSSNFAVLLYFAASLLPDPDVSFSPSSSCCSVWTVSTLFEILQLASRRASLPLVESRKSYFIQQSLGASRALLLAAAICLFLMEQNRSPGKDQASAEQEGLLENGRPAHSEAGCSYGSIENGTKKEMHQTSLDAQSIGWLDYFAGFSLLFPYICYHKSLHEDEADIKYWPSDSRTQQFVAAICFLLLIAQRAVNVLVPYQLGKLVQALGQGQIPLKEIGLYIFYRGLQGQQGVLGSLCALLYIPIGQSTYRRLTSAAFEHIMSLSLDFHLDKRIGEVMTALSKGNAINTFLDSFAFQIFPMVLDLGIAAIFFIIEFNAFYALIVIAVMWTYIYATIYMAKYRGRARREMTKRDREMDAAKCDAIMSYETVHHNGALPIEIDKFGALIRSFQTAEFSVLFSLNLLNSAQITIFTLGILLVCLLSSYEISVHKQEVAMFVTLLTYFAQLQAPLHNFGSYFTQVQNTLVDAERMLDLFKENPKVTDRADSVPLHKCRGKISFSSVHFAYDSRKPALTNVSFTVEPGTTTAIVGESGSGKSTCLKLLFRFYDVDSGSIHVDEPDIRKVSIKSLRAAMGVVPQDTVLFNASIKFNLMYARPEASLQEMYDACRTASIHETILGFPDGYETMVGERGLRLSGGEKQRVAMARAILKKPPIMLLDEATSSLDSHTEKLIERELERMTDSCTTLSIAHRLSTITKADQILVFHEGSIVERGRHAQLLAMGGRYKSMWDLQAKKESL